jgi:hypothetical protein
VGDARIRKRIIKNMGGRKRIIREMGGSNW